MTAHILQHLPSTGGLPRPGLWRRLRNLLARRVAGTRAGAVSIQLGAGQELALRDSAGWTVACRSGSVWITQEADSRDNLLSAGESFTLDRRGLTLVLAWKDSGLVIQSPAGAQD